MSPDNRECVVDETAPAKRDSQGSREPLPYHPAIRCPLFGPAAPLPLTSDQGDPCRDGESDSGDPSENRGTPTIKRGSGAKPPVGFPGKLRNSTACFDGPSAAISDKITPDARATRGFDPGIPLSRSWLDAFERRKAKRLAQRERRLRCESGLPAHFVYLQNDTTKRYKRISLPCKQRGCRLCSDSRRQSVKERVDRMVARAEGRVTFGTLTFVPQETIEADWLSASTRWAKFWRKLRRKLPRLLKGVGYAWVLEPHRSGRVHLHFVVGCNFLHYALVQKLWNSVEGGHSRVSPKPECQGTSPGKYVGKYVAKFGKAGEDLLNLLTEERIRIFNSAHCPTGVVKKPLPKLWRAVFKQWTKAESYESQLQAEGFESG